MQDLAERLEPYTAGATEAADVDQGWTIVLIDSVEPSEGDFVMVESYNDLGEMVKLSGEVRGRMLDEARHIIRCRAAAARQQQ